MKTQKSTHFLHCLVVFAFCSCFFLSLFFSLSLSPRVGFLWNEGSNWMRIQPQKRKKNAFFSIRTTIYFYFICRRQHFGFVSTFGNEQWAPSKDESVIKKSMRRKKKNIFETMCDMCILCSSFSFCATLRYKLKWKWRHWPVLSLTKRKTSLPTSPNDKNKRQKSWPI